MNPYTGRPGPSKEELRTLKTLRAYEEAKRNMASPMKEIDIEDIDMEPVYATLHFYYDNPDSMRRFKLCNEAETVRLALWDFKEWLHSEFKWGEDEHHLRSDILEEVYQKLYQVFDGYGLNLDEE
jgi:hypothetical protein